MALKTTVKVSQISNMTDARYAAGMMVDYLGFKLNPSDNIENEVTEVKDIFSWVQGPELILEFEGDSLQSINSDSVFNALPIAGIQTSDLELFKSFKEKKADLKLFLPLLFAPAVSMVEFMEQAKQVNEQVIAVLDLTQFAVNPENMDVLKGFCLQYEVLLSGLDNEQQITQMLNEVNNAGLNLTAGVETKPGFKEFDFIVSVLENLEIED